MTDSKGLSKKELNLFRDSNSIRCEVNISQAGEPAQWSVTLTLTSRPEVYTIETTKGVPKTWLSLGDAIIFVQKNCPSCKKINITVGNWLISTTPKALDCPQKSNVPFIDM